MGDALTHAVDIGHHAIAGTILHHAAKSRLLKGKDIFIKEVGEDLSQVLKRERANDSDNNNNTEKHDTDGRPDSGNLESKFSCRNERVFRCQSNCIIGNPYRLSQPVSQDGVVADSSAALVSSPLDESEEFNPVFDYGIPETRATTSLVPEHGVRF